MKTFLSAIAFSSLLAACGDAGSDPQDPTPDAAIEQPAHLAVTTSVVKLPILQGTTAELVVTVQRLDGATGPVAIALADLPAGVTASALTIPASEASGTLTLTAAADAPHSLPTPVAVHATLAAEDVLTPVTVTVYGPPGSVDTSFGGGRVMLPAGASDDYANAIALQADGKILVAGRGAEHLGDFAIVRLDRDGSLDTTFGDHGRVLTDFAGASDTIFALAVLPDGKILAAGTSVVTGSGNDFALARYTADGALDTTFGQQGKVTTAVGPDADTAYAMLVAADGKILLGGDSSRGGLTGVDFALVRYTASGALDTTFAQQGIRISAFRPGTAGDSIYALAFQTVDNEQRIVAAGGEGDMVVARYHANGALDTDFGTGGSVLNKLGSTIGAAYAVAITGDGHIALAGHAHNDIALLQLEANGAVDTDFGAQGKVITAVTTNWDVARAITSDAGRLVVAGWAYEGASSAGNFVTLRYLATGQLDPTFGGTGIVTTPMAPGSKADEARAIAIQSDERVPTQRIIVAGSANNANSDFAVARLWR